MMEDTKKQVFFFLSNSGSLYIYHFDSEHMLTAPAIM